MARADRRRRRSGRRRVLRWVTAVLVLVLVGAAAAAYRLDLLDRWTGDRDTAARVPPPPGLAVPAQPTPSPVAEPAPAGRPPTRVVRRALAAALADPHLADLRVVVAPLVGPRPVLDLGHGRSMPASTLKLLTTTAALEVLGPGHTFTTRVVARGRTLTLVGGGDPFLAGRQPRKGPARHDASLQTLARLTAQDLRARHVKRVRLTYDATLFAGPAVNPHWPKAYIPDDVVSPISALWADEGLDPSGQGRVADPPAAAAARFAAFLHRDGVAVTGRIAPARAPAQAREVAHVTGQPLGDVVERVLQNSDNEGAEVLLRQTAIAVGNPASFAGGVAAVRATLHGLGIDLRDVRTYDGSGLSRQDRLDAETLVRVLQLDASPAHPELRSVVTGLPVAAYDGSLVDRFTAASGGGTSGRGWVRAKTGTLTGTSALAGLTTDARGRVLVFALVSNHVPQIGTLDARAALDRLAAALADCPC